jgi:hypothetical protein
MHKCRAILDTSLDVAADYEAFWLRLKGASLLNKAHMDESFADACKSLLRNHQRSVQALIDSSAGVSKIVRFSKLRPKFPAATKRSK